MKRGAAQSLLKSVASRWRGKSGAAASGTGRLAPHCERVLELQRLAGNTAVSEYLASPTVQRFESNEHKSMGDAGTGSQKITLAPGLDVTFGDITALAGDYFGSADQIRSLASRPGDGKSQAGTRDEIEYALHVKVRRTKKDADYGEAVVNAVTRRYYTLAGTNVTHFSNPSLGDESRSQLDKANARDVGNVSEDVRNAYGLPPDWQAKGGRPVNNAGSYRQNHILALEESARAGAEGRPKDNALLYEAFASHFLTDAYSAGHLRTPRAAISEHWNPRVPMFWYNLKLWMSENIAKHLNDNSILAGIATVQYLYEQAQDTLNQVVAKKGIPDLTFGDAISGAVHDLDNEQGVVAQVGDEVVKLVGDGQVLDEKDRPLADGVETAKKAAAGVRVSLADVESAYSKGKAGETPAGVVASLTLPDGLFKAEQLWPKALSDSDARQTNKAIKWQVETVEELFADPAMKKAIANFAHGKADTLGSEISLDPPLKADKELAMREAVLAKLKAGEDDVISTFRQIINYTPGSATGETGGLFGHDEDDDALTYYQTAKAKGALGTLTLEQRKRLVRNVLSGATMGDEETMIADLLTTNSAHVVGVVNEVGWRWIWDDVGGDNLKRIIRIAGPVYWAGQPLEAKKREVFFLSEGWTSETAQELIIVILRTCSPADVRAIDSHVGWPGLNWDLTGSRQDEFDVLKGG